MRRHYPSKHKKKRPEYPLKGLLYCEVCGGRLTASNSRGKSGKQYGYYHCTKMDCKVRISIKAAEDMFLDLLEEFKMPSDVKPLFSAIIKDVWRERQKKVEDELEGIRKRIKKNRDYQDKLTEKYITGKLADEIYQRNIERIRDALDELHELEKDSTIEDIDLDIVLSNAYQCLRSNACHLWKKSDLHHKQKLQTALFPDGLIVTEDKKVGTPANNMFFNVLQDSDIDEIRMATPTGIEPVLPA